MVNSLILLSLILSLNYQSHDGTVRTKQNTNEFAYIAEAEKLFEAGKYYEAVPEYEKAIRQLELSPLRLVDPDLNLEYRIYCKLQLLNLLLEQEPSDLQALEQLHAQLLPLFGTHEVSLKEDYSNNWINFSHSSLELAKLLGKAQPERAELILRSVLSQLPDPESTHRIKQEESESNAYLYLRFGQLVAYEYPSENPWKVALEASRKSAAWLQSVSSDSWSYDAFETYTEARMLEADALYSLNRHKESADVLKEAMGLVSTVKGDSQKQLLKAWLNLELSSVSLSLGNFSTSLSNADQILSTPDFDEEMKLVKFEALSVKKQALELISSETSRTLVQLQLKLYPPPNEDSARWIRFNFRTAFLQSELERLKRDQVTSPPSQMQSAIQELRASAVEHLNLAEDRSEELFVKLLVMDLDFLAYLWGKRTQALQRLQENFEWLSRHFPYDINSIDRRVRYMLLTADDVALYETHIANHMTGDVDSILFNIDSLVFLKNKSRYRPNKAKLLFRLEAIGVSPEFLKPYKADMNP